MTSIIFFFQGPALVFNLIRSQKVSPRSRLGTRIKETILFSVMNLNKYIYTLSNSLYKGHSSLTHLKTRFNSELMSVKRRSPSLSCASLSCPNISKKISIKSHLTNICRYQNFPSFTQPEHKGSQGWFSFSLLQVCFDSTPSKDERTRHRRSFAVTEGTAESNAELQCSLSCWQQERVATLRHAGTSVNVNFTGVYISEPWSINKTSDSRSGGLRSQRSVGGLILYVPNRL